MPRLPRHRSSLGGFTLIELMVVLAILASMAAISWPAVRRMLGKSELADAGKQVRSALVKARLRAIESGAIWQFDFEPGTGRFTVSRTNSDPSPPEAPRIGGKRERTLGSSIQGALPRGVVFEDGLGDKEDGYRPILFQSNGRAGDARIRLIGQEGRYVDVAFRGLTGTATVGPVRQPEAVQ